MSYDIVTDLAVDVAGRPVLTARFGLAAEAARAARRAVGPAGRAALRSRRVQDRAAPGAVADLMQRAAPGQILVTATTAVLAGPGLPADVELVDAGWAWEGDGEPERLYELRAAGPGTARSSLAWAHRAAPARLVGRDEPLAALAAAWAATRQGEPHHVVVSGGPGAGKTALVAEHALAAHAGGGLVLYGRADPGARGPAGAVVEALGSHAPRPQLDRLASGYDAVATCLDGLAAAGPVLMVLDDLHRAAPGSWDLLRHLRDVADAPWMVVATSREAGAPGGVEHVELAAG
jgi:hypothetical protein